MNTSHSKAELKSTTRRRAFKPKVRTGCRTCKIRRIKCDEQKPECNRCRSTGRECDGLEAPAADVGTSGRTSPSLSPDFTGLVVQPSPSLFSRRLTSTESESYDFFRTRTAQEVSGCFDSAFWKRLVLQVSCREPSILHAVIAVGSVHRSYESNRSSRVVSADAHQLFGLQQYNKAIGHLKARLCDTGDPKLTEIVLISCVLFICLELLQGQNKAAITHLQNGLKILCDSTRQRYVQPARNNRLQSKAEPYSTEEHLVESFSRLDIQSAMFGERSPRLFLVPQQNKVEHDLWVPETFRSLIEARQYLDTLTNATFRFRGQMANNEIYCLNDRGRPSGIEDTAVAQQQELQCRLTNWSMAFDRVRTKLGPSLVQKQSNTILLLRIHNIAVSILLSACLSTREIIYDELTTEFEMMISLANRYLEDKTKCVRTSSSSRPTFTLEMGIIPPLYLAAIKCRHPEIRRQAVSLLSCSPHREGMWDTNVAKFAVQIIALEEAAARLEEGVTQCENVPEHARFHDVALGLSEGGERGKLTCGRFRFETDGQWDVREESFAL